MPENGRWDLIRGLRVINGTAVLMLSYFVTG